MTTVELEDRVAEQLQMLKENAVHISDKIEELSEEEWAAKDKAFAEMAGMYDDDITDLSSTIRETLAKIYGR